MTFKEISEILGIPTATLRKRMESALKKVRNEMRKWGFETSKDFLEGDMVGHL